MAYFVLMCRYETTHSLTLRLELHGSNVKPLSLHAVIMDCKKWSRRSFTCNERLFPNFEEIA